MFYKNRAIWIVALLAISFLNITRSVFANSTQSASLREEVLKFSIAQDYFSDILNSQITIFSVIVAIFLTINWIYQRRVAKEEIKKEVKEQIRSIKKELNDDLAEKQKALIGIITERLNQGDVEINLLRGEV